MSLARSLSVNGSRTCNTIPPKGYHSIVIHGKWMIKETLHAHHKQQICDGSCHFPWGYKIIAFASALLAELHSLECY